MAVTPADDIIGIEIRIDGAGISSGEVDDLTRQLAAELRELPHESVGIVADQAPVGAATTPSQPKVRWQCLFVRQSCRELLTFCRPDHQAALEGGLQ